MHTQYMKYYIFFYQRYCVDYRIDQKIIKFEEKYDW